jgi:predicted MFS family arabinose efflux permease
VGSAVASALFSQVGWAGVALVGAALPGLALLVFVFQARQAR